MQRKFYEIGNDAFIWLVVLDHVKFKTLNCKMLTANFNAGKMNYSTFLIYVMAWRYIQNIRIVIIIIFLFSVYDASEANDTIWVD